MVFPSLLPRRSRAVLLVFMSCAVAGGFWLPPSARAQQQESGFLDRIDHPDRTLHYSPSDKQFSVSSSVAGRQAAVRPFMFGRSSATLRAGDGAFSTHAFQGTDHFRTDAYETHAAAASRQEFSQTEKTFGTKTMDVREDRAAGKTAPVREYTPGEKPYLGRGKRQDTIDEIRKQKDLTIDQVRELLNKSK